MFPISKVSMQTQQPEIRRQKAQSDQNLGSCARTLLQKHTFICEGLNQQQGFWAGALLPYTVSAKVSLLAGYEKRLLMIYVINGVATFKKYI